MQEKSKKLIESTSPEVSRHAEEWGQYELAFAGGEPYAQSAIVKHPRESESDYKTRQKQAYPIDLCRHLIMARQAYLFQEKITPELPNNAKAELEPLFDDIDMRGNSFNTFADNLSRDSMKMGSAIVLVDATRQEAPYRSRFEQKLAGARPYLVSYSTLDVQNFSLDRFGALNWMLFKNGRGPDELNPSNYAGEVIVGEENTGFTLWTRTFWSRMDKEGNVVDFGDHNLGFVPVVNIQFAKMPGEYFGLSLLRDIEPLVRRIIGLWGCHQEIINNQTFGQLCIQDEHGGKDEHGNSIEAGTKSVLFYSSDQPPSFIQPDASNATTVLETIRATEIVIERESEMAGSIAMTSPQVASGVALAYKFRPTNMALCRQAKILGPGLARVLWMMAKMMGVNADLRQFSVPFPPDFGVTSSTELIDQYSKITSGINQPSEEIVISLEQKIYTKLNPDLSGNALKVKLDAIRNEISSSGDRINMPPTEEPADEEEQQTEGGDNED